MPASAYRTSSALCPIGFHGTERSAIGMARSPYARSGDPVGWCQWYRWDDYPAEAAASGAHPGEIGADYAIGDAAQVGRGVGTAMIASLVDCVRAASPGSGILIAPEAANVASRRVLEKNGFHLVDVRPVATEPHGRPMALYRLPPGDA